MRIVLVSLLTLAYPLLVYFGIGHFEPRWMALMLAALACVRAFATRERVWLVAAVGALLLAGVSALGNQILPLKLYPVLVNLVLLVTFASSLMYKPSMIERLARLREPNLSLEGVAYTYAVTQIWCGFFLLNGSIAFITAFWASDAVWALYNGLLAYVFMGCLFAVEWLVRRRFKAKAAQ